MGQKYKNVDGYEPRAIYDIIDDWKLVKMPQKQKESFVKSIVVDILLSAAILAGLFMFFWPAVVNGPSMEPTFLSGDYVIISRFSALTGRFSHNDFVASRIYENGRYITIIKRLVAIEGDYVEVKNGIVFVNGEEIYQYSYGVIYDIQNRSFLLNKGEFFVTGDNGMQSLDSRIIGPLTQNQIIARVLLRIFPFSKFEIF